ncbi:DNA polymerase [uncultured Psychromonas sp.]|uniref:DNA polymerase n=1 Tax=uncultured Psychromonas sp. TaxID=173974 RepID=UPI002610C33E|nr:DNA polymerase [uncultured Psychromonas sp.]
MALLQSVQTHFKNNPTEPTLAPVLPINPDHYSGSIERVNTVDGLRELIVFAYQLPLTAISVDFEFNFTSPAIPLRSGKEKYDIRSIQPLLMAVTLVSNEPNSLALHNSVIDLTKPNLATELQPLLDLPVTYIAHHAKAELHCLWKLGLREPNLWWDTCIAERARYLGKHVFDTKRHFDCLSDEIEARNTHKEDNRIRYGLAATTERYGIEHQFSQSKADLQQSFLNYRGDDFSQNQIEYTAEDAIVAAKLYLPQYQQLLMQGVANHLITVEMPWVITNAAMEWHGVVVDREKCNSILNASTPKLKLLSEQLAGMGLENPNSHQQKEVFFQQLGLLDHFNKGGQYSFKLQLLKDLAHIHPAIELLAEFNKVQAIERDLLLKPAIVGEDGRVHPEHKQLEVVTGRQSCANPNLLGLPGVMRPLIISLKGYGICEADYAQVEIAITAAVYGDANLVEKFNQGDIYTAMAQEFFAPSLSEEHRTCNSDTFKQHHKDKRDIMKQCTLGIIYGLSAFGLASRLKISEFAAKQQMAQFLAMFPTLERMMDTAPQEGAIRGYVSTSTGLQRQRVGKGGLTRNERNWMVNMPVQGTAAAIFKVAGNRLYQLYKAYDARLILAVHDAFIFEAPLELMDTVAELTELTEQIMIQAVQEYYPQIKPRVDLNYSHPECWTKDSDAESVERWIAGR